MFRKLNLFIALFVFTLSACELQEPVDQTPVLAAAEGGSCEAGGYRSFEMEYWGGQGSYFVTVETGLFQVSGCMCKMVSFKLYVSKDGSSNWRLFVGPSVTVPYALSPSQTEDILTITDLKSIYENIGNPGTGKVLAQVAISTATLNLADGLCIVENYDGSGTTVEGNDAPIGSWADSPIVSIKPGQLPDTYTVEVFIPVGITSPI